MHDRCIRSGRDRTGLRWQEKGWHDNWQGECVILCCPSAIGRLVSCISGAENRLADVQRLGGIAWLFREDGVTTTHEKDGRLV
jgi:hypothetical protein